jgi:trk system potassium uptake protein TrkH
MNLNIKAVVKICGLVTIMMGLFMTPAMLVSVIYREFSTARLFMICIIPILLVGLFIYKKTPGTNNNFKKREGVLIVALAWAIITILGAIPYLITGSISNITGALFETASGFTTTGASVIDDVESLPRGILFWRSLTHWFGGLGIIFIAVSLIPMLGYGGHLVASAEASNHVEDKITGRTSDTMKRIAVYYLALTILCIIFLLFGGMNVFDSFIHSFGTISTGGFSSYNTSVAHFDSHYIDWVIIVFMLLGSTNFTLYYFLFSKHWKEFFKDTEFKWYILLLSLATIAIIVSLVLSGESDIFHTITISTFEVVTTASTTGFAIADYNLWPTTCLVVILLLMFMGGSTSSTAGGIKTYRIVVLIKLIHRNIIRRLHPSAVIHLKSDDGAIKNESIQSIAAFVYLYIFTAFIGTIILSIFNNDMMTCFSAVISAMSNVGPGFNEVGPTTTYSSFNDFSQFILTILMIAGRLELFGIIMVFLPRFWNPDRRRHF